MPQAIPAFLNIVWAGVVNAGIALGLSAGTISTIWAAGANLIKLTLLNTVYNKLFVPDVSTSSQSYNVTTRGTIEHQRMIYGETLTSGLIWYMNAAGDSNQSLHYGIVVAGHRIEDMTDMWINDTRIPEGYIDWSGNGRVNSGDFRGNTNKAEALYFHKFLGTDVQSTSPDLLASFTEISSSHMGKGIAWFLARADYFKGNAQVWSAGAPDNIRALVKGKRVYDPRSHSLVTSTGWEWSDNPALCWADYMMDNNLGFGESSSRIDWNYVSSAAAICEGVVYTPVGTDKRFRCNGVLSTADDHATNLRMILSAMNGTAVQINGKWKVRAYAYNTPTLQFNDDDLRGDLQINLHPRERERFNTVRGTFIDKDRLWKAAEFPEFTSSEYVSRDNNKVLYRDISLHMTKDRYAAQRLAAGILEQSDNQITCVVPTNYHSLPVEVGGTIMLSNTKMGWTDKVFRVERYKFQDMGGIDLIVREDSLAAYTDVGTAEYTVSSGGAYLQSTHSVPSVTSLWVNARIDGNLIYVTPPAARLYEEVILYSSPTSAWTDAEELVRIKGDSYFHPLDTPRKQYYFAIAENFAGAQSDRFQNSDYSSIFGVPDLSGTRLDTTFDLSNNVNDFWEGAGSAIGSISNNGGENGEHSMRMTYATGGTGATFFRTKARIPIQADEAFFRFRYKVSSFSGVNTGQAILNFGAFAYHPTPVSSNKFITAPNTYTQVVGAGSFHTVGSLGSTGVWRTHEGRFPFTNAINSAATVCAPYMSVAYSDTVVSNNFSLVIDINWISWYWV